jgi:hypothetical protein
VAFACSNQQTNPVTRVIGLNLNSQQAFDAALLQAMALIPDGGTCPGEAIDFVVKQIESDPLAMQRPIRSAVLMTDGIYYDAPRPQRAAYGLQHFCAQTFALGLPGGEHGLNKKETATQMAQLTSFVGGNANNVFNFGVEGYNLLGPIANSMIAAINASPDPTCMTELQADFPWCGYTSNPACTQSGACKWPLSVGRCFDNAFCGFTQAQCNVAEFCVWGNKKGCQHV